MKKLKTLNFVLILSLILMNVAFPSVKANAQSVTDSSFKIDSITVSNKAAKEGTTVKVDLSISYSGTITYANLTYSYQDGKSNYYMYLTKTGNVYEGTMNINKYTYPGKWKLTDITFCGENSEILYSSATAGDNFDLSTGDFEVQGTTADTTAPTFKSVKVNKAVAYPNDVIILTLDASDDISGLDTIYAEYKNTSANSIKWVYFYPSGNKYISTLPIESYNIESGLWQIDSISLSDKAGNETTITNSKLNTDGYGNSEDLSAGDFQTKNTIKDVNKPVLNSITIDKKNVKPGDTVTVTVDAADDFSGLKSANLSYKLPSGKIEDIRLNPINKKYQGKIYVGQYSETGTWNLLDLSIYDNADNILFINGNDSRLSSGAIEVSGTTENKTPVIQSISVNKTALSANDILTLKLKCSGSILGISSIGASYKNSSNDYLYISLTKVNDSFQGSLKISKYTENGTWNLNYIYIYDNANDRFTIADSSLNGKSSSGTIYKDLSKGRFEVKNNKNIDYLPPVFNSIKIDKTSVNNGGKVTVTVTAKDNLSGVSGGYLEYALPSGKTESTGLNFVNNTAKAVINIDKYSEPGLWKLSYIDLYDAAGNTLFISNSKEYFISSFSISTDLDYCNFTVKGTTSDTTAPEFKKISLDSKSAAPGKKINLTLQAKDNLSGIAYATATYILPNGSTRSFGLTKNKDSFTYSLNVGKYTSSGTWKLSSIYLLDNSGNSTRIINYKTNSTFYTDVVLKDLSSMDFTINSTKSDTVSPEFKSIKIDKTSVKAGQKVTVTLEASDNLSGIDIVSLYYITPSKEDLAVSLKYVGNNKYVGTIDITKDSVKGLYQIEDIYLTDAAGNRTYIHNSSSDEDASAGIYKDLSNCNFTV